MTYIEFFDRISVVNICACLTNIPERVVLVGGETKAMLRYADYYRRVFRGRGHEVEFICKSVRKNSLSSVVDTLLEVIGTYGDCAVDLTGGDDLALVAMGIVYERCAQMDIQLHRFNIRNNTIYDCDEDGLTIRHDPLLLTVEENIRIYGGDVVYDEDIPGATHRWQMDEEFDTDIQRMWEICRGNPRLWNTQVNILAAAETFREENEDPLATDAQVGVLMTHMEQTGARFVALKGFLKSLYLDGLLDFYYCDDSMLSVIYKNEQVKRCLTKAGLVLEMKVYSALRSIREPDGSPMYDVLQGVWLDWDGQFSNVKGGNTANEVDVIAMKGVVPIFISCKNGILNSDELYKLNSVAERFGAEHAKKVLITTALDDSQPYAAAFRQRAEDMKIRIVDDLQQLSEREIDKMMRNLWH